MTNKARLTRTPNEYEFIYHEKPISQRKIIAYTLMLFITFIASLEYCL